MRIFKLSCVVCFLGLFVSGPLIAQDRDPWYDQRLHMVNTYLIPEGITNKRVIQAMKTVPRHEFVTRFRRQYAYSDTALAIGYGQTISPPFIVAYMTQTLDPQPDDKVLEIGTGSGYQAAVLGQLCQEVYSIEIVEPLGKQAGERLKELGYDNVTTKVGDGYQGWPEHAPFDKIIVTCSPEKIPEPLKEQLAEGGRMVIPVGERYQQVFYLIEKKDGKLVEKELIPTLFVPMTGVSEQKREVKPDPLNPKIVNGSFELDENEDGKPDGWHYQRQLTYLQTGGTNGQKCVRFFNLEPGHTCQALQGMGVDGQKLGTLQIRASAAFEKLRSGPEENEEPGVHVYYYDSRRKFIGSQKVGPWVGNSNWKRFGGDVPIPSNAREMVLQVGINGGTGTLLLDDVRIRALPRQ